MRTTTPKPQRYLTVTIKLLLLCALFSTSIHAQALSWPQFRGPESNPVGTHAKLAEHWSKTENVEWSQEIPGRGWSSPIVTGGKVYLTSVTTEGKSKLPQTGTEYSNEYAAELQKQGLSMPEIIKRLTERDIEMPNEVNVHYLLYCLDLKSGKVEWSTEFHKGQPPSGRHRKNSFVSETPVTDGKFIYVYVTNLGLYAFDLKGKAVWNTPIEPLPIYLDLGAGSSPALAGDLVIVLNDNQKQQYIAAFDKKTGKQVWRTDRDLGGSTQPVQRSGWSTPFVWKSPQRTEIVAIGPEVLVSYDLAGKELWRLKNLSLTPVPTPFAYDGLLYVNGGRGRALYAIRPGATGDISLKEGETSNTYIVWAQPRGGTYLPSALAYQGNIYTLTETGILNRFDAKTGKQSYKTRIDPQASAFTTSPWAYNGMLFCLSEEGQTFVVTTGDEFKLSHVNQLDDFTQASPALVGERLLIRTEHKLYSIRRKA
ncbi:MAG TPA: PQQ-binding-like beta-propeller repeat protein [Pyrinomonadaceae bacterium]|nr:PQQ-binding-like beta-propeller repeat protein [Pyrinomonadaceae bacterium]